MNEIFRITHCELYFIPVQTRMPLKFGAEILDSVVVARCLVGIESDSGKRANGWGETPLSAQWAWPSKSSVSDRVDTMKKMCIELGTLLPDLPASGHPMLFGINLTENHLDQIADANNAPHLAALVSASSFDIAIHDAYANMVNADVYRTYGPDFISRDLASMFGEGASFDKIDFAGQFPSDFLEHPGKKLLKAWHLVGGKDPIDPGDLTGEEPDDRYPVMLDEWIEHDNLSCLKVKLRGTDEVWDYDRLVRVGELAFRTGVDWLSTDFNCTVTEPSYVNEILDRLRDNHPRIYGAILYVEQPFPYDLEANQIDVHSVSSRKPLFMDESAHDWRLIRLGKALGWSGVALKTCKTQTGAILSLCWAKAHDMQLMVQDLTNPMIAQIPHLRLASHAGTIMGVETNGMQFYPDASLPESVVHPGMYRRTGGIVDLSSLGPTGFGYRIDEIERELPTAALTK